MKSLENQILNYIAEHTIAHPKDLQDKFTDSYVALSKLQSYKLVEKAPGKQQSVILTLEGKKACKMGFEEYLQLLENQDNESKKEKKWKRIKFIIELIVTVLGLIVALLSF